MEEDNYDINGDNGQDFHFNWNGDDRGNSSNQELNINNNQHQNQSFGNNNMSNANSFSHYGAQNRMPSTSGLQNNRGLSSGQKDNNKNNNEDSSIGSSLKGNKNDRPFSDETNNNNKSSDSSTNNDSNKNDNKDNKSNNDSSNNADNDNKSKGLGIKRRLGNAALGGVKKGADGLNNLGNDGTETDNPDDPGNDVKEFGQNATNVAVGTARGLRKIILFIIKFPWVAIIIGIIILVLFLIILFATSAGSAFSGIKFSGWYCNMYSPTTQENPGEVSSFYGWRIWNNKPDDHKGIDISYNEKGAEIRATHDGIIKDTNYTDENAPGGEYGVYILIEDPEVTDEETKYRTYYAHMCSLKEEQDLRDACLAGTYDRDCDSNCKDVTDEEGNVIGHKYIWSCGENEEEFKKLIDSLKPGMKVEKNQVIGYVSDTGYRSGKCDFHLHFEAREDNLKDDPDKGFIATSPNRFFTLENSTLGCDPVLSSGENATSLDEILRWECEKPIIIDNPDDELVDYCAEYEDITPPEYRFNGDINIKRSSVDENGNYVFEEGLGTYVGEVCGYEPKPVNEYGDECASGVFQYYNSFLPSDDSKTWNYFLNMRSEGNKFEEYGYAYGSARTYWNGNSALGEKGFKTGQEPKPGSIFYTDYSESKDESGKPYGHVMAVTKVEGDTVYVYECNGYTSKECGNYTYTKDELDDIPSIANKGYIYIIDEENCEWWKKLYFY